MVEHILQDFLLLFNMFIFQQKQPPELFCKKGVLKNFGKFAGKQLCWSLFLNKVAGLKNTVFTDHLWATTSLSTSKC